MSQTLAPGSQLSGSPADSFGFRRILYSKKDYIATITINRPDVLNCFDMLTLNELGTAYLDAGRDDDIAVVVITGAGDKAFCTGADLKEQEEHILKKPNDYYKWMYAFIEMHDRRVEWYLLLPIANAIRHTHPGLAPLEQPQFADFGRSQAEKVRDSARWVDEMLAAQPWIAGERFTIADITAFCALEFARGLLRFKPGEEGFAALQAWRDKVAARPSAGAW